jgi:flavin reductase (DIM6/NTAB) family NADH-FMN oxidoreductase RutF
MPQLHFGSSDIQSLEKTFRANLINSVSGYKPANLIGTCSAEGQTNLAIFSSVVHLGADPALLGFIQRPVGDQSHTFKNIMATGVYTINHVHESFVEKAHYTSARFEQEESEFDACNLTPEYLEAFTAPFVAESWIKVGMRFEQVIPITLNNTILVIGRVEHLFVPSNLLQEQGSIALDVAQDVCISGLDAYYRVSKLAQFPYAKRGELPDFE